MSFCPELPPGWVIHSSRWDGDHHLGVTYTVEPTACPDCGGSLRRNGLYHQVIHDAPNGDSAVLLELSRQRYCCRECRRTVLQPLPDVPPGTKMTARLAQYIQAHAGLTSPPKLAEQTGLAPNTVRSIIAAAKKKPKKETKRG